MPKKHKEEKEIGIKRLKVIVKVKKRFRKWDMNGQKTRKLSLEDMEVRDLVLGKREEFLELEQI